MLRVPHRRRAALAAVTLLASAAPAVADDDVPIARAEGLHLGVGVESTLGGVAGLSFRHGLGPIAGVELVVAAGRGPGEYIPGGSFGPATTYAAAVRLLAPLRRHDRGWVGVVGGVDLGVRTQDMTDALIHPALEAGLRAELFLTPALSASLEVGAVLDLPPERGRVLTPERAADRPDGAGTSLSLDNTALAGGAGLTFWIK